MGRDDISKVYNTQCRPRPDDPLITKKKGLLMNSGFQIEANVVEVDARVLQVELSSLQIAKINTNRKTSWSITKKQNSEIIVRQNKIIDNKSGVYIDQRCEVYS